jgi:hypothetical protein
MLGLNEIENSNYKIEEQTKEINKFVILPEVSFSKEE